MNGHQVKEPDLQTAADATGLLKPLISDTEDVFVDSDLPPVAKLDGEVAVVGIIVPAGSGREGEFVF